MSRKRTVAVAGIALLATLGLIERATNTAELVPANTVSVEPVTVTDGPDQWRVVFELSSRDIYETGPVPTRPLLGPGDPVCLRQHRRAWADTKFTLTGEISCWEGAVTPLRRPGDTQ